ncbi:MAG: threonylcarbamoyl-AMP synthase [Spirochaetaceae bacterium 4572_7]|nr:MAG: threonylcarbamoyl-AMP synthase [Spirochaetaceae bacterium 4572_7]
MNKQDDIIEEAGKIIQNGGLVIFPTETVYGLGANALNATAVGKIFLAKERPTYDPLIVHIDSISKINMVTSNFSSIAKKLADKFWPGPLTLILPKSSSIPYIVTSNLESVGVRIPNHPIALKFLQKANVPIAGPSANKFGYISPTKNSHLKPLENVVDLILDGGECSVGIESTIVSLLAEPKILRMGKITREEIEDVIGPVDFQVNSSSNPEAPGMLERHYAPKTRLEIYDPKQNYNQKVAWLGFNKNAPNIEIKKELDLSPNGDLIEAAENLYSFLRELDSSEFDIILIKYLPNNGVGMAINDKIKRASN